MPEIAGRVQKPRPQWYPPGVSGNPLGRPKGSRHKLGEAFIDALHQDFKVHGAQVIEEVREKKPAAYLTVIASIVPKELNVNDNTVDGMTEDQLIAVLNTILALRAGTSSRREVAAPRDITPPSSKKSD